MRWPGPARGPSRGKARSEAALTEAALTGAVAGSLGQPSAAEADDSEGGTENRGPKGPQNQLRKCVATSTVRRGGRRGLCWQRTHEEPQTPRQGRGCPCPSQGHLVTPRSQATAATISPAPPVRQIQEPPGLSRWCQVRHVHVQFNNRKVTVDVCTLRFHWEHFKRTKF